MAKLKQSKLVQQDFTYEVYTLEAQGEDTDLTGRVIRVNIKGRLGQKKFILIKPNTEEETKLELFKKAFGDQGWSNLEDEKDK